MVLYGITGECGKSVCRLAEGGLESTADEEVFHQVEVPVGAGSVGVAHTADVFLDLFDRLFPIGEDVAFGSFFGYGLDDVFLVQAEACGGAVGMEVGEDFGRDADGE